MVLKVRFFLCQAPLLKFDKSTINLLLSMSADIVMTCLQKTLLIFNFYDFMINDFLTKNRSLDNFWEVERAEIAKIASIIFSLQNSLHNALSFPCKTACIMLAALVHPLKNHVAYLRSGDKELMDHYREIVRESEGSFEFDCSILEALKNTTHHVAKQGEIFYADAMWSGRWDSLIHSSKVHKDKVEVRSFSSMSIPD